MEIDTATYSYKYSNTYNNVILSIARIQTVVRKMDNLPPCQQQIRVNCSEGKSLEKLNALLNLKRH